MTTADTVELKHEGLRATFRGVATSADVVQYRGIKFASIAKRFARSELVTSYGEKLVDCTVAGPNCPGRKTGAGLNTSAQNLLFAIPADQTDPAQIVEDEFECLNLNITVPKDIPAGTKLPVLFNIPGGANTRSASGIRLFDYTRLVEASIKQNKPIIAIHVPYRVGYLGYGVLPDGLGGNNALYDQRNAFEWVKRNISAFGGDPNNITAAGESAGGFSVDCHLHAKGAEDNKNLQFFKRAVLMSGTLRVLRPKPRQTQLELTRAAAQELGFTGDDWVEKLTSVNVDELLSVQDKIGVTSIHAVEDEEWFDKPVYELQETVVPSWCESLMIGDCGFEGFLWFQKYQKEGTSGFVKALEQAGDIGHKLLAAYPGLQSGAPQQAMVETLRFMQDVLFSHPSKITVDAWRKRGAPVYEYVFDQANPWDKARLAHHACDLLYWFGAYDLPTEKDQTVSDAMKRSLIAYVNGETPWSPDSVFGFGPDGYVGEVTKEEYSQRRRPATYGVYESVPAKELYNHIDALQRI